MCDSHGITASCAHQEENKDNEPNSECIPVQILNSSSINETNVAHILKGKCAL